jgi:TRAP-type C4-dicarboxylate transport system substrate-binding protein
MRPARGLLLLALAAALAASPAAGQTVKLATLVPEGSFWDRALRDMGAEWERVTGGDIRLRIYAGGVAGDDPDLVRKLRIGQLQAATVTVTGLTEIDPAFAVFEIPGFFESYEELFHVLAALEPELERRLQARGFRLLHWGHGGWVYFFSTEATTTLRALQDLRVFVWAGNDRMTGLWRRHGFRPVALAATDVLTGLETGLFQTLPTAPIAALSLQWYRSAPYMTDLPLAPLLGATIIDERAWQRLPEARHSALLAAAADTGKLFAEEIPAEERKAIVEMQRRGLETIQVVGTEAEGEWRASMARFAESMRETFVPEEIYDAAFAARAAYRDSN